MKKITFYLMTFLASIASLSLIAQPTTTGTGAGTGGGITNSYYGFKSGRIATGTHNTFTGYFTGYYNTTGRLNTFNGSFAGYKNTTGEQNTFIGFRSGQNNTTAKFNSFLGAFSGQKTTTGERNSFIGYNAGVSNSTGGSNTLLGYSSGHKNTTGSSNTYLGYMAGRNNQTGSGNVLIGYQAGFNEAGSNKLYIDNSSTAAPLIHGDFATNELTVNGRLNVRAGAVVVGNSTVTSPGNYKLYVQTGILTEKVKIAAVNSADWADYVFAEDYKLNSIQEVEAFIKKNNHLPNVPSAKEVSENGLNVAEMDATLLRQIEELWLHMIELKKENEALKAKLEAGK